MLSVYVPLLALDLQFSPDENGKAQKMLSKILGTLSLVLLASTSVCAQKPLRRYQPPGGPTLSPYLNYNRPDFAALPDSHSSFVVPQQRLRRELFDLGKAQQADVRRVEADIQQIRSSAAAPTGVGASFLNYSHYYQRGRSTRK
jgi:hypothetical protein